MCPYGVLLYAVARATAEKSQSHSQGYDFHSQAILY